MYKLALAVVLVAVLGCENQAAPNRRKAQPAPKPAVEVLAFTASWCGPCKRNEPALRQLENEGARIKRIDIDQYRGLARQYGISQVPTYVVENKGQEIERTSNVGRLRQILKSLKVLR